ncbi:undecaprenyldiphospho-muramoylpentapeptide beta-N-acetylglucosaminyltransferase [Arsenicitalea aurantiaca]|uniref:UDP-N-acetylglucosamine--N-acetylmuramyl-(pentapeptide) pyrophosphoryl-undecaprenol N-acetylglucosamine transferase n=1 Tax=Arsenicitalea aurantiaca TaxID=1783274 RepID=A0A433XM25_9HYPH|nr:undecaprenyldiphospho-muramoylpentapeptide beta-N-acetylglucosaminyltransferase [Arsenicitalea aurantiaca]RUT35121.1 undecaprenyldiphospho-muramoylpentapeptide beta-N-acetylglucosaminyltransferase [Arsenicitalea aurantiaca]
MSTFVLMAGGTGGHLFPAMALAQELRRRGHLIHLMTDHRVASYGEDFPAEEIHVVPAATPSIRNPIKFTIAGFKILYGIFVAGGKLSRVTADAVIGFGGYPTFPPFLAARLLRVPGILHEQNAVLGRANKALARFAQILALSFADTLRAEPFADKTLVVGNPVRDRVRAVTGIPYPAIEPEGPIRVLVFGGSQGASAFADLVPAAIATLPPELRSRLEVTQQCRREDLDRVAEAYRLAKVNVEISTFFGDLPERMAASHLVIARSGASTIAELCVVGRPAILIPLPGALDADQKNNALFLDRAGGGWIAEQATLSPLSLGTRLASLFGEPESLVKAAAAARAQGQPEAVERLADAAEALANKKTSGNK